MRRFGWGIPPLGLAAISAYIRQQSKCDVRLIDMLPQGVTINDIPHILNDFQPDIIGLSATTPQIDNAYLISRIIKRHNPRIKTVIGGAHVTALPQRTFLEEPSIDFVIMGEGEIPFLSLVKDKSLDTIKSLAWRKEGDIIINEREALIEDLGRLPFPDYESLPIKYYGTFYAGPSVGITSSRGCYYNCSYCASHVVHLSRCRFRPIEIFLDDIQHLLELGAPRFDIWDDTFTFSKSRVYEFLEGYHKRNLKTHWSCVTRVDCLDQKLLKEMHRGGVDMIHIGCESGNQVILDRTGKKIKLEQVREVCDWCEREGIAVYVYFMLGLPGETEETVMETIDFAKRLPIDFAQFSILVPYPGTRVWDLTQEGKTIRNLAKRWSDYDRYGKAFVELNGLCADKITELFEYAVRSFYLRPSYLGRRLRKMHSVAQLKINLHLIKTFFKVAKKIIKYS